MGIFVNRGNSSYDSDRLEVYIPNEEVRGAFATVIRDTDWTPVISAVQASDALLRATWNRDGEAVARGISQVHRANTSILEYNDENSISCVVTLAYYNAVNEYTLIREMPTGKGYADIVFLPRRKSDKPAMVIELKYDKSARGAIAQILERRYPEALKEYRGNLLLVGINYQKETKEYSCVIQEWEKGGRG